MIRKAVRACNKCGLEKPESEFSEIRTRCQQCQIALFTSRDKKKKAYRCDWEVKNKDRLVSQGKVLREKHRDRNNNRVRRWKAANPDKAKAHSAAYRANLTDAYVAVRIVGKSKSLTKAAIPQSLIDIERERIRLIRKIKELST